MRVIRLRVRVLASMAAACCVCGAMVGGVLAGVPAAAASGAGAVYVPLGPVRVMDTRLGVGVPKAPVGAGKTVSLQVAGVAGVPSSGVSAVVLNVTATGPTAASSYVTVYPDGATRPGSSSVNFTRGQTIANLVVVPVGSDGKVDFFNAAGRVNLVADLSGYYTSSGSGSLLDTLGPVRVMDTRLGIGVPKAAVGPGKTVSLQVAGADGVPASGVSAVVLNVTATGPTAASSYLTVYPAGAARPGSSNVNFTRGQTIANLVVVPVGSGGKVTFYNAAGSVNVVADLSGYYTPSGAGFAPLGPVRVMDTRLGIGAPKAPVGAGKTISLQVAGVDGVPASGVSAVVLNVTATGPTAASSYVTAYPDGGARPGSSSVNFTAGETIANLVVVPVGPDGKVDFYNAAGRVNLVADLSGYYTAEGPSWGDATEVPGTAALNTGGSAEVSSVSCPSAGNCTASGQYADSNGFQVFVADEVSGTWGDATELPGIANLNVSAAASVSSLSCASAGNCVVGGYYADASGNQQAFVADEVNGTWSDAIEVPGTSSLNSGNAVTASVSCGSAGNCTAGGYYSDSDGNLQAWVADEVNGTWGNATEVAGALNTGGYAQVNSVSCASAGNCTAGGSYSNSTGTWPFVADEVNGTWDDATEIPGTAALNSGASFGVGSVSCASAGNCAVGGSYNTSTGTQAFVADEVNGTWGDATEVPGTAALNTGGGASVFSVSCPSAGNCAVGGEVDVHSSGGNADQPFVADEVNGTWGDAIEVPGIAPGPPATADQVSSVSCSSAGNCVADGYYGETDANVAFVVSEVNGSWGDAIQVPGTPDNAVVESVSCPPAGSCAAGGYQDISSTVEAIVASQN